MFIAFQNMIFVESHLILKFSFDQVSPNFEI